METTIKATRQKLGCTQKQMASLLGTTQQGVGRIEKRADGRTETKQHIAHLIALELLAEHDLISELMERLVR